MMDKDERFCGIGRYYVDQTLMQGYGTDWCFAPQGEIEPSPPEAQIWVGCSLTRDKHLYVFSNPDGHYKIGIAKDVEERRRNLQCGSPQLIRTECFSVISPQGVYAADLEREVHALLAHANVSGEWFKASPMVIGRAIKEAWIKLYCPPLYGRWQRFGATEIAKRLGIGRRSVYRVAGQPSA
jgi:hypothetical protein